MTTGDAGAPASVSGGDKGQPGARRQRSLVVNTTFAAASAGSAALLLALLILAAWLLGSEAYGRFSFALALAVIFETLMDFGLKEITIRGIAREPDGAQHYLRNTFGLKLVLGAASVALIAITASMLRHEVDITVSAVLLGVAAVLRSYMTTIRSVFYGLDRFDLETAVLLSDRSLVLCFGAAALLGGYGVVGLSMAFLAARAAAFLVSTVLVGREVGSPVPAFDLPFWRDLQLRAAPFGAFVVIFQLYNYIDTVMLGVMRGDADTGLYNAAYRVYEGFAHVPSIISVVLTPRLAREFVQDPHRHRRTALGGVIVAAVLGLPATLFCVLAANPVVHLLYGASYEPSVLTLQILGSGFAVVFPLAVLHSVAISANAERTLLVTGVVGCLVNVLANLMLIPAYGMNGAALATVIGEVVSLVVLGTSMWRTARPR